MATSPSGALTPLQDAFVRAFQARAPGFFLTGGAVLAGFTLRHRTTDDLDLFTSDAAEMSRGDAAVRGAAADVEAEVTVVQASPDFRRYVIATRDHSIKVDVVLDRAPQLEPKRLVDGVRMDSLGEVMANKLSALVGRQELRDLVDVRALELAGLRVEVHLAAAAQKDGGVTPAVLAWLLDTFPIAEPVPGGVAASDLRAYASDLARRMRTIARP